MPYILSGGQSNNDYYAQGTPTTAIHTVDTDVSAWNSQTLTPTDLDTITNYGTAFVHPYETTNPYNVSPGLAGSTVWACHKLVVNDPLNRGWAHIHSPRGGQKIDTWYNGSQQHNLTRMRTIVNHVQTYKGVSNLNALVFDWQGNEADCSQGTDLDTYKTYHHGIVANLMTAGALDTDATILITGLHPNHPHGDPTAFNAMLATLASEYTNGIFLAVPNTIVLTTGTVHWDAAGQYTMGIKKYQALANFWGW